MNHLNPVHRLCIEIIDDDMVDDRIAGYFHHRTNGELHKQHFFTRQRRLLKTMSEEEIDQVREALSNSGYEVESLTVIHSPSNTYTYRRAFQKPH